MIRAIFIYTLLVVIVGCASHNPEIVQDDFSDVLPNDTAAPSSKKVTKSYSSYSNSIRRVAWVEGDFQNGYQSNRNVAVEKLQQFTQAPDEKDTDKYLDYIATLGAAGRFSESEKLLKVYIKKYPQEKRAVFLLAVHYARTKRIPLAQYLFQQLERDSEFSFKSVVLNNLGMLALQEKNKEGAIEYFEKATKATPPTAAPYVNLGSFYLQSRSYGSAEKLFRQAVAIDGDFEDAVLGLGVSLEGIGKAEEAHQVYAAFLESHTESLSVLFNDAVVLGSKLNQKEQAAQMMLRYIQRGGKETAKAQGIIQTWR